VTSSSARSLERFWGSGTTTTQTAPAAVAAQVELLCTRSPLPLCWHIQTLMLAPGVAPHSILVMLEATGTYWITLATALAEAHFALRVIPRPTTSHRP